MAISYDLPLNFQYSDETATILARQLLDGADASSLIAVVSAPSVFIMLKNIAVCCVLPASDFVPPPTDLVEKNPRRDPATAHPP